MHARELAVLASWLVFNSGQLVDSPESRSVAAAQQYWTSFKCRMQRWMDDLSVFEEDLRHSGAERVSWTAIAVVVEEILISETLTRIWAALTSRRRQYHAAQEMEAVARSVYASQIEARNCALRLIVSMQDDSESQVIMNHLRVQLERWNDVLLSRLPNVSMAVRFAYDVRRMIDFSEQQDPWSQQEVRQRAPCYGQMFHDDLLDVSNRKAANPDLNSQIAEGVLGSLEIGRFELSPLPDGLYRLWVEQQGVDTQLLVDQLVRLDVNVPTSV